MWRVARDGEEVRTTNGAEAGAVRRVKIRLRIQHGCPSQVGQHDLKPSEWHAQRCVARPSWVLGVGSVRNRAAAAVRSRSSSCSGFCRGVHGGPAGWERHEGHDSECEMQAAGLDDNVGRGVKPVDQ